ncbi:hypothetical protein WME98_19095 [Sorangium sp. So ce296]|uniref:hypothetical protein n=1 Tax=Sorangium sp. So ce296 TaxID=3133296 RepID=UPI003F64617D
MVIQGYEIGDRIDAPPPLQGWRCTKEGEPWCIYAAPRGDAGFSERLERLRRVKLPWSPAIVDGGMTEEGRPYVVTEPAGTPVCLPGGWQGIAEMLRHALNAAGALSAAHEMGVCHGDLTLESLSLDARGEVRIARLGFLALFRVELCEAHRPQAPEVLRRGYPTGPQADVYSLAAILDRIVRERLPAGAVLPAPLAELITRGTAEHHEERYTDMLELFDRLRDASTEVLAAQLVVPADRDTAPVERDDGPKTPRSPSSRATVPASIEIRAVRRGAAPPAPSVPELPAPPPRVTGPVAVVALGLAALALGTAASLAVLLRPPPIVVQVPAPASAPPPSATASPAPAEPLAPAEPPAPAEPASAVAPTRPASSRAPAPRRTTRTPTEELCESEGWYSCTMRRPARR